MDRGFNYNPKFTENDLQAGMLVKLHSGRHGIILPLPKCNVGFEVYDNNCMPITDAYLWTADCENNLDESFSIVEVYGLSRTYALFDVTTRDLLWRADAPVKMTLNEIEEKLGYKIKLVED